MNEKQARDQEVLEKKQAACLEAIKEKENQVRGWENQRSRIDPRDLLQPPALRSVQQRKPTILLKA